MRQCGHCGRWAKNKQAVRGHLKACAPWLAVRAERGGYAPTLTRHPGDGLGAGAWTRRATLQEAVESEVQRQLAPYLTEQEQFHESPANDNHAVVDDLAPRYREPKTAVPVGKKSR